MSRLLDCYTFEADRFISDHDSGYLVVIQSPDADVRHWDEDGKEALAWAYRWAAARGVELRVHPVTMGAPS